jgi:carbonic anhydrase
MNRLLALVLLPALLGCASQPTPAPRSASMPSPDESLRALLDGNARFVADHPVHGAAHASRRAELTKAQHPIAVVVCCSDSRVGPEIVFDQDLGDIFVIRTAGNVVDDVELGSIEYAVEHLKTPLILVVGHERCGAVTAAVEGGEAPGHLPAIVRAIAPAVEQTKGQPGDAVDNAVRQNVRDVVKQLRAAGPILAEHVHAGGLKVMGARYDLDTGRVELVD